MRTLHNAPIEAALVAIAGLATLAVIVSSRAHTQDVVTSLGNGFSRVLAAAISPIFASAGQGVSALKTGLQQSPLTGSTGGFTIGNNGSIVSGGSSLASAQAPLSAADAFLLSPAAGAPASDFANEVPYDNAGLYIDGGSTPYQGAEITVSGAH